MDNAAGVFSSSNFSLLSTFNFGPFNENDTNRKEDSEISDDDNSKDDIAD
jgi:hypothetical protein